MTAPVRPIATPPNDAPRAPLTSVGEALASRTKPPITFGEHFVMCPPVYLSTAIPNNVFMEGTRAEPVDKPRALRQYERAKRLIEALGATVLEIPPVKGAQDQEFTANIAVAIDPYIILANYKAPGRAIEVPPANAFFRSLGYQTVQPPTYFEGEADLKRLNDKIYIGGYGQFSDARTYDWIEQLTGVQIVRVRETNAKLYHLDCSLMPLDEETIIASPEGLDAASMRALEHIAHVIPVPKGLAAAGVTNGIKITEKKVYLSGALAVEQPAYRKAVEWLLDTLDQFGYVVTFLDTDAVDPSGADLSCTVMRLTFPPPRAPRAIGGPPAPRASTLNPAALRA